MITKKCKIVMLPSKKANIALIGVDNKTKLFQHSESTYELSETITPYDLYIISDDEIKEGDWVTDGEKVYKAPNADGFIGFYKIIATTDKSLFKEVSSIGYTEDRARKFYGKEYLPQIPQSFIEHFVSEYNKDNQITEVMVEYEKFEPNPQTISKEFDFDDIKFELKTNPNNTINIKPIKDSWSREEVVELIFKAISDTNESNNRNVSTHPKIWIEENL